MIVTLCGSTKFKDEFLEWQKKFSLQGHIVLTTAGFSHADKWTPTPKEKVTIDTLHLRKIAMSDAIFVINKDGYIGASTSREIEFAKRMKVMIRYMEGGKKI